MNITLLSTVDPDNKIVKSTTNVATLTGSLKGDCSVTDPQVLISAASLPAANYAHIPDLGNRYYYIKDVTNVSKTMWLVSMHVDVLMSYSAAILSSPCIIAKTASRDYNLYLPDPNFKCQQNDRFGMVNFPGGFDTSNARFYVLMFGGGSSL